MYRYIVYLYIAIPPKRNSKTMTDNNDQASTQAPQHDQQMGKWMLILGWIVFLVLATMIFGYWEREQHNPNRKPESYSDAQKRSVTLKRNRNGHYVTNGLINGQKVTFMLDTGATMVAVPNALGGQLGLDAGLSYQVSTANGPAKVYATEIDLLELGPLQITQVRAALSPGMNGKEILLGMSALKDLEFTQRGNELTLVQYIND